MEALERGEATKTQTWYLVAVLDCAGTLPMVVDVRYTSETAWGLTRHGRRWDYAQLGVLNLKEGDDPGEHARDYCAMAHPWALRFLDNEMKLAGFWENAPNRS